jgi:outer membrane protein OmpA-like peptidoglycan-associated protein
MSKGRFLAAAAIVTAAGVSAACGPRSVRTLQGPGEDLIVLLADPDSGAVGRASVWNRAGAVDLTTARAATVVGADGGPAKPTTLSEGAVRDVFGPALEALPPEPRRFTLFFRFDSEELTDVSRMLLREVLAAVEQRPHSDIVVRGHTDTTGATARNFTLGLRRANTVRGLLVQTGLDPALIDVASHGEAELLVPTADNVVEPLNRRVEITVR